MLEINLSTFSSNVQDNYDLYTGNQTTVSLLAPTIGTNKTISTSSIGTPSASSAPILATYKNKLHYFLGAKYIEFNIGSDVTLASSGNLNANINFSISGSTTQKDKYVYGGLSRAGQHVVRIDLETKEVKQYPAYSGSYGCLFIYNNYLHIINGNNSGTINYSNLYRRPIDDFSSSWETVAINNSCTESVAGGACYYFFGEFLITGSGKSPAPANINFANYNHINFYNPATNTFREVPLPSGFDSQYHQACHYQNGKVTQISQLGAKTIYDVTLGSKTQIAQPGALTGYHHTFTQAGNVLFYLYDYSAASVRMVKID